MDNELPKPAIIGRVAKRTSELLPPTYSVRWGLNRKAVVIDAIDSGLMRLEDALDRYRMSIEEYHSWRQDLRRRRAQRVRNVLAFGRKRMRDATGEPGSADE